MASSARKNLCAANIPHGRLNLGTHQHPQQPLELNPGPGAGASEFLAQLSEPAAWHAAQNTSFYITDCGTGALKQL